MKLVYLIILSIPFVTELLEVGHFPVTPQGWITEVVLTLNIGALLYILERDRKRLDKVARTDPLTGVFNRKNLNTILSREIIRAQRKNEKIILVFLDVDYFKKINDQYGHEQGDRILIELGERAKHICRNGMDFCFRVGGDEFVMLFSGFNPDKDEHLVQQVQKRLQTELLEALSNDISVSFGIAVLKDNESAEEFVSRADSLMYQSKRNR